MPLTLAAPPSQARAGESPAVAADTRPTETPAAKARERERARSAHRAQRIRLSPTRLGFKALLFHVLLTATFFAIPYSNLFFLGIAFLSVIAVANVVWAHGNMRGVVATVPDLPASPAGAPIAVRVLVHKRGARAGCMLTARVGVEHAKCTIDIGDAPGGTTVAIGELPPLSRGVYAVRTASVESTYPHGLLRATRAAPAPAELVVYPAPRPIPPDCRRASALVAHFLGNNGPSQQGVAGLRDWRAGDDPRSVHWRASARRGQFVVREPDADDAEGLEIVLDRRCAPDALELALATIATFAQVCAERKERLALHTQGGSANYGPGGEPMVRLWRVLALAQCLPATAPPPPPAPTGALRLPSTGRSR